VVVYEIDGAENNELALTNNKHGEVAKYFTYNMHQMVPDMLVGNLKFLNSLTEEELEIFKEAAQISNEVELEEWDKQVEEAKQIAVETMGVEFLEVEVDAFKEKVMPLHQEMLSENPDIVEVYQEIQKMNEGFYYFIQFDSEPDTPGEIEQRLRIMDNVIRYLCVRQEA